MLDNLMSSICPEEWTGDMFKDNWHSTLSQVREEIASTLDKLHKREAIYLDAKLNINSKN